MSELKSQAWFKINEAILLDVNGKDEEAFGKYLEGVQNLCAYIKDEITFAGIRDSQAAKDNVMKVITNMTESLERVENIVSKTESKLNTVEMKPAVVRPVIVPSIQNSCNAQRSSKHFGSLEIAYKKNEHLRKTFQKLVAKDGSQRTTLSLEFQRRIQENIALAKTKELEVKTKQAKEESEALLVAARKLATNSCAKESWSNGGKDWSNKVTLCANAMRYRGHDDRFQVLVQQLQDNPTETLVTDIFWIVLRNKDHPLTVWLWGNQQRIKSQASGLLEQQLLHETAIANFLKSNNLKPCGDVLTMFDPLQNINSGTLEPRGALCELSEDICCVLETFLQVFSASLDLTGICDYVDSCYAALEDTFFTDVWPIILQLYRLLNKKEESFLCAAYKCLLNGTGSELNMSDLLSIPENKFNDILGLLKQFSVQHSPLNKLQLLVDVTHCLCEYDSTLNQEKIISADDLIGRVSCLLVQSNQPQLLSEIEALEQLIPHRFLLGEEGYSLTTFQTAIKYLESKGESMQQTLNQ